ncbi:2,5-diamino-6-ribosylamino-4(3H)-pyrimidinone 5'-phosphate reductase [Vanrija pseudolonga]|uniref:2,5-diamino-6-ribosylamino-4(3H)-pyrimidinone 5'-phosphate reductase n=1 Tax=Vanrija pseudolonga TaxID=143232 RepID=A0AAF0Y8B8_9TREE|nr:2,5-diamino-6-ribosylamino-4(3H)-pyrimidinone 5'-phosphate reductase [Vanrija pseudolonga]
MDLPARPVVPPFLTQLVASRTLAAKQSGRPHVTLTWAQSLDAKLAGPGGARVILSGKESMLMTHWLRTMHDAILIGVSTAVLDDPRLKIQLVPQDDPSLLPPQPIVFDPSLRLSPTARMISEWAKHGANNEQAVGPGIVRQPWIVCGEKASLEQERVLVHAGARVIRVVLDDDGLVPPTALPEIMTELGLSSIMIEGGSRVLSTFLHAGDRPDGSKLVDSVIVTVAPAFIGEGVGVVPVGEDVGLPPLKYLHTETMGKDAVMVDSAAKTILMHLDSQREGQAKFVLKDIDDHHVLVKTAHVEEIRDALASELEKNTYVPDPDMR